MNRLILLCRSLLLIIPLILPAHRVQAQSEIDRIYERGARDFKAAVLPKTDVIIDGVQCSVSIKSIDIGNGVTGAQTKLTISYVTICGNNSSAVTHSFDFTQLANAEIKPNQPDGNNCFIYCKAGEHCMSDTGARTGNYEFGRFKNSKYCEIVSATLADVRTLTKTTSAEYDIPKNRIIAEYSGHYSCGQGDTALTLQFLRAEPGSEAVAVFKFPSGAFSLSGFVNFKNGTLDLYPLSWLSHPPGYLMVGLSGTSTDEGKTFNGRVLYASTACTSFSISRNSASSILPEPIGKQDISIESINWENYGCGAPPDLRGRPISAHPFGPGATVKVTDWRQLNDSAALQRLLDKIRDEGIPHLCDPAATGRVGSWDVAIMLSISYRNWHLLNGYWWKKTGTWDLLKSDLEQFAANEFRNRAIEEQQRTQQQHELEERQKVAAAKKVLRENFISQFKVQIWTNADALRANVFVYKDKVVGVYTTLDQMLTASEAQFNGIISTNVPTSEFTTPGQQIVLALKVEGLRPAKILGTDISIPYGVYVGSYKCRQAGCSEFFD